MSEFHDPEFEKLLGSSGGPIPDVNDAYQQVQGRVRQVKRRRAVVASGAACVVLFGAVVFAGTRTNDTDKVSPADRGSDVSNSSNDSLGASTSSPSPDSTITSTTLVTDATSPSVTSTAGGGVTPTQPGGSTASSSTPGNTTPGNTTPGNTTPSTSPPATDPPAPVDATFSSGGNSITVRLQNSSLGLLGAPSPAGGYVYEVKKSGGTRVEVRFDNGTDTVDIRVDLVNGQMVQR